MLRERQLEQEERLANELARLKHESLKDEKMRQQVRENRWCGFRPLRLSRLPLRLVSPLAPEAETLH